jgi:hypothetical protein
MPTPVLQFRSPYFTLFQHQPDYSILRSFGCACFPLLRPYNSHKLAFRSKKCIFLGYSNNHKGYRCLDPHTNRVYLSRHVVFDETLFPAGDISAATPQSEEPCTGSAFPSLTGNVLPLHFNLPLSLAPNETSHDHTLPPSSTCHPAIVSPIESHADTTNSSPTTPTESHGPTLPTPTESHSPTLSLTPIESQGPTSSLSPAESECPSPLLPPISTTIEPHGTTNVLSPSPTLEVEPVPSPASRNCVPPLPRVVTRSQTNSLKPKQFPNFQLYYSTKHPLQALSSIVLPLEPRTYNQAVGNQNWKRAMQSEFDALLANKTWSLCPRPVHKRVVRNKWVFKLKQKSDGTIDRYKARLVAKGFDQEAGIDFTETFSPVIKPATIRLVLALAIHYDWCLRQLDVSNAFLHGHLEEEVFMEQPKGFEDSTHPEYVCKLHKSLYGLKQAPRAWFLRLSQALLELGFSGSSVDTSLFYFHRLSICIFVLVYVDDIIVTSNSPAAIDGLITNLQREFAMKDLGPLSFFLGIQASRDKHGLHLHQGKYITELLHRVKMAGAKPASTPCITGSKMSRNDGESLPDPSEYRHMVGALQYCTLTRPDISYSVNQLCQFLHSPTSTHLTAAKRVLRYLKGTLDYGLYYTKGTLQLNGYCDSDWAGSPDDRKSITGYGIYLGPCLISWAAKKQPVVARSSTEAEYRSMALTVTEMYWLRMLFKELHIPLLSTPCLWVDNIGALALSSNPVYHARTKHIEVDYHFIREKIFNKDIVARYISTHEQPSDIFTKGLSSARFSSLRVKLMVHPLPISLRGDVNQGISTVNCAATVMTAKALNGGVDVVNHDDNHEETTMTAKEINCRKGKFG